MSDSSSPEACVQVPRGVIAVGDRLFQAGPGLGPVLPGDVDQRQVVADQPEGSGCGRRRAGAPEIGGGLRVPPGSEGEDSPVQGGVGEAWDRARASASSRPAPARSGRAPRRPLPGCSSTRPTRGRERRRCSARPRRRADARGGSADPLEEMGPEFPRLQLHGAAEFFRGEGVLARAEVRPAQVVMLPGRARAGASSSRPVRPARALPGAMRSPEVAAEGGARAELLLGVAEDLDGLAHAPRRRSRAIPWHAEVGQNGRQVEEVGADPAGSVAGPVAPPAGCAQQAPPVPDRAAAPEQIAGLVVGGGADAEPEAEEVDQLV